MAELRPSVAPGPAAPPASGPSAPPAFASLFPPGLHAIYGECRRLYPDQPNPLQVTAIVKYWLGGPDPLDYVSMYRNMGSPSANIPEHWHYISFGLSDLYGDNRVHEFTGTDGPSGFGFELTFRLKRETGESAPPTWPAELMQGLARYVFQSENTFCSGDHVSWHSPLDNSESRIQHMLLTEDPQMQPVRTPFGVVTFLQIVGVCTEELHSAQQWNGQGILELLRTVPIAGGPWLITDMRRGETIFEIDPHLQERVDKGIETDGSNLSGVSAKCAWDDLSRPPEDEEDSRSICLGTQPRRLSGKDTEQIRETLRRGLEINSKPVLPPINSQRQNGLTHDRAPSRKDSLGSDSSTAIIPHELIRTRQLESVHLKFNQESGALIPLCLRGRLLHGRHFTYKSITGDMAITFVSTGVEGAFATEEHPYAAHGPWLQILLTEEFVEKMLEDLEDLTSPEEVSLFHFSLIEDSRVCVCVCVCVCVRACTCACASAHPSVDCFQKYRHKSGEEPLRRFNDFIFLGLHGSALPSPHPCEDTQHPESPALGNLIEEVARACGLEFSPAPAVPWQILNRKPVPAAREHSAGSSRGQEGTPALALGHPSATLPSLASSSLPPSASSWLAESVGSWQARWGDFSPWLLLWSAGMESIIPFVFLPCSWPPRLQGLTSSWKVPSPITISAQAAGRRIFLAPRIHGVVG